MKKTKYLDITNQIPYCVKKLKGGLIRTCNYFLALGENKKLYVVDKSKLSYRIVSLKENNRIEWFNVIYYNKKIYYVDHKDTYGRVIKKTDGDSEAEIYKINGSMLAIKNKLYIFNNYYATPDIAGIKYIDMDNDKVFSITNIESSYPLYLSENELFYVSYKDLDNFKYQANYMYTLDNKENQFDNNVLLKLVTESREGEYGGDLNKIGEDKYIRPDLIKVGDKFIIYSTSNGVFIFDPNIKTFLKISDIKVRHAYYTKNKFYLIHEDEIGYIDFNSSNYIKVFSKSKLFLTSNKVSIDEIDEGGDITFTIKNAVGKQRFDVYTYKYLINENKLKLISFTEGSFGEFNKESIQNLKENGMEVDN